MSSLKKLKLELLMQDDWNKAPMKVDPSAHPGRQLQLPQQLLRLRSQYCHCWLLRLLRPQRLLARSGRTQLRQLQQRQRQNRHSCPWLLQLLLPPLLLYSHCLRKRKHITAAVSKTTLKTFLEN